MHRRFPIAYLRLSYLCKSRTVFFYGLTWGLVCCFNGFENRCHGHQDYQKKVYTAKTWENWLTEGLGTTWSFKSAMYIFDYIYIYTLGHVGRAQWAPFPNQIWLKPFITPWNIDMETGNHERLYFHSIPASEENKNPFDPLHRCHWLWQVVCIKLQHRPWSSSSMYQRDSTEESWSDMAAWIFGLTILRAKWQEFCWYTLVLFPLILSRLFLFCFALLSFCHQDTHNDHRDLQLPTGDVLIHAGDFTQYGKEEHARDFNAWLGDPRRKMMIVKAKSRLRCPQRV